MPTPPLSMLRSRPAPTPVLRRYCAKVEVADEEDDVSEVEVELTAYSMKHLQHQLRERFGPEVRIKDLRVWVNLQWQRTG